MKLQNIYQQLPTKNDCIKYLEEVRWNGIPKCPHCKSTNSTPMDKENRHHCNACNTSFSVTVRTIFHRTRIDLQKWFYVLSLIDETGKIDVVGRQLARTLNVNKDTASFMLERIYRERLNQRELVVKIIDGLEKSVDIDLGG